MSVTHEHLADGFRRPPFWKSLTMTDWAWAVLLWFGAVFAYHYFRADMGSYGAPILCGATVGFTALGWFWKPLRLLGVVVAALSLFAIWRFDVGMATLAPGVTGQAIIDTIAKQDFFLRFMFAGETATMWMSALFVGATVTYYWGFLARSEFIGKVATALTWSAVTMGLVGLMVRWRETYLMGHDVGHIPVSNLYEVFILFCLVTALLYLFYEQRYRTRALGGFVLTVVSAAIAFLLWYTFNRDAAAIHPLIPALQSYWMKMHVPANFVGYGSFALASMVAVAYLLRARAEDAGHGETSRLPSLVVLDDVMYKSIALGFAFFTIATVLGSLWADVAWGSYWSWDPKETWALIVWLNYAAWLHLRLSKGLRGRAMAWWAIIGLLVTTFAFLGVNMFLSGLHSYGGL